MSTSRQTPPHPSFLALDRLSLRSASSEVGEHVAGCELCQQHLRTLAQALPPSALSGTIAAIERRQRRVRTWWAGSLLAAAACLVLALGRAGPVSSTESQAVYVGSKGFASVWIYVKRGGSTTLWDGKRPVAAGDRLRIKLDSAGFTRIEVYSVKDPNAPELLYSGSLTPGQSTLPDAWEVDGEPGDERLVVALTNEPVKPDWARWLKGEATAGVSVHSFVLPKSTGLGPDAGAKDQ